LEVLLALIDGFPADDRAHAYMDLRDADTFVSVTLDTDTKANEEWVCFLFIDSLLDLA
jgi:hypothetical protein